MELSYYSNSGRLEELEIDDPYTDAAPQRTPVVVARPQRWDRPFARAELPTDLVQLALSSPVFQNVDPSGFPDDLALADIIANDARPLQLRRGERLYRQGDYGTSVFVVLHGRFADTSDPILGIAEALTRRPRDTSPVAETNETIVLEIRWSGVRELRQWSEPFRALTDHLHARHALQFGIRRCHAFARLDDALINTIAAHARVETYGQFEWSHAFRKAQSSGGSQSVLDQEPVIAAEGEYLDELIVVASGTVRVTASYGTGEATVGVLGTGQVGGLMEVLDQANHMRRPDAGHSFASGYRASGTSVVVRIPTYVIEDLILPSLTRAQREAFIADSRRAAEVAFSSDGSNEHSGVAAQALVDRRLINGTQAMAIDLDRCVNCDECVRACAASHGGVSRFVRQGQAFANVMITHACMHCHDPVCMIGCPTGAIHRQTDSGVVTIEEDLCIGCTICANTCPYDNIRMEQAVSASGRPLIDDGGGPILKAIKCDLCYNQPNGPACQRACPHDALKRVDISASSAQRTRGTYIR